MKLYLNALVGLVAIACTMNVYSAPQLAAGTPAVWTPHELIVDLHDLPTHYTCDDLWYRFRDILMVLGARRDAEILPYRCGSNSPAVQLKFSILRPVKGKDVRWEDVKAVEQVVRIVPGSPKSLNSGDCELARQVKASLLKYLDASVTSYKLACQAPASGNQPVFEITAQVLQPAAEKVATVAAAKGGS